MNQKKKKQFKLLNKKLWKEYDNYETIHHNKKSK